jgi:hypothetical protein
MATNIVKENSKSISLSSLDDHVSGTGMVLFFFRFVATAVTSVD